MFSNHVYKIIILPTLLIRIPNLEIFLFCQHNSTAGGNLELRQTIVILEFFGLHFNCQKKPVKVIVSVSVIVYYFHFFSKFSSFYKK
jgi:uncharacterized membrane protein (UPF0136 family)